MRSTATASLEAFEHPSVRGELLSVSDFNLDVGFLCLPEGFRQAIHVERRRRLGEFLRRSDLVGVVVRAQPEVDGDVAEDGEAVVLEVLLLVQILEFQEIFPAPRFAREEAAF